MVYQRLKSTKAITALFTEGNSVAKFPVRIYYQRFESGNQPTLVGVSVSKRNFKNAVDRNRIKRLLRVAFAKNSYLVTNQQESSFHLMILYVGNVAPTLSGLNIVVCKLLQKVKKAIP